MPRFDFGSVRFAWGAAAAFLLAVPAAALAGSGAFGVQGTASDLFDNAADDYDGGPGINFFGVYRLNDTWDLRADVGARFLEGDERLQVAWEPTPNLGARRGERSGNARVLPFTVDLVYRAEKWSAGRFWVPYVGFGLGFYDLELTYVGADEATLAELAAESEGDGAGPAPEVVAGEERTHHLYEFGWNGRVGVNLHRTSGIFVNVESGVHGIQTERRWQPMWDVAIGVGTVLPID